ncbi:alpha-(1,3)-fucosyltransferase C-like isoform X1 [Penaeus monodon]|uniref:alpha-(1,3)-fucosyltransferase C-like isoform X1 n=1 Tax=Penaeus monodon TaxID=6687 RepID=UPI0018A6D8D4|nr:alpha-(1,3)-fucosyltransferase C-like isoform X1 [Penaeus monodon]
MFVKYTEQRFLSLVIAFHMTAFVTLVWFLKRFEASVNFQPRNDSASISISYLENHAHSRPAVHDGPLKKILLWNDFYGKLDYGFGTGREPFQAAGCRVDACMVTIDRNLFPLEEVDALVWHTRSRDVSMPERRSPHTRYVLVARESPGHNYSHFLDVIGGQRLTFNWSFSYADDSEIRYPYGRVIRREAPLERRPRNYAEGKTKLAAWFVSNCNTESKRENLAKTLQKWVTVDVYGSCGPYRCAQANWRECHALLNATYKFYLSFENSLCRDYVTEKFFTPLLLDVVPVVYGYANYSRLAPPHSYIDALSFNTTRDLAEYLLYLDKNDTAYNEYFRWKPYYEQLNQHDLRAKAFCDLCERLHSDREPKNHDVNSWFDEETQCLSQEDSRIKQLISE